MNKIIKKLSNENGSGLVLALMVLLVLSALGSTLGMVTINSHRLANHTQDINSAYYIAEAGANMAFKELENEIPNIYSDSSTISPVTFFNSINKFIYTDDRLHNTNYQNFSQQNGENPKAEIKVFEKNENEIMKEYIIESEGIIGSNSRTVKKRVLVRWFDKDTDDSNVLPFPLPPLGTAITFSEKINFSGTDIKVNGDIIHTGSGIMNIEDSWVSEHNGNFVTDTSINLSKYTVDLSKYKPQMMNHDINLNQYDIPRVSNFPRIPSVSNQVFDHNTSSIMLQENTYIPSIEKKWGESLDIYIPDQEVYLIVDKLVLGGLNKINIIGNGKLNLVVRNNLTMSYDLKINQDKPTEKLNLIYNGTNQLNFPDEFKYSGNIFSSNSSINIPSNSVINGFINTEKSIVIGSTTKIAGNIQSHTGNIDIGYNSSINGSLLSENGNIIIGDKSKVMGSTETHKGNITIKEAADMNGRIISGSGNIIIGDKSKVSGDVLTKSGNIDIGFQSELLGSVISGLGNIDIGGQLTIPGDIITKKGDVKVAANSNINGMIISGEGDIELGFNNIIKKGISTIKGNIIVEYGSNVTGNVVTDNGEIKFVGASKVKGTIHTGLGNISFGWDSSGSELPTVDGNIITNDGEISIGGKSLINGVVMNSGGNVNIGQDITLNGIVFTNGNDLNIGWNTTINGALIAGEGKATFNGSSKVNGTIVSRDITFGYQERIEYSEEYLEDFSFEPVTGDDEININIEDIISTKPATEK